MHHNNRPGAGRDAGLQAGRVEIVGALVHIAEDRPAVGGQNGGRRGPEGIRGDDHLIPRLHAGGEQRLLNGRGAVAGAQGVFPADIGGEFPFQPLHGGRDGYFPLVEHIDNIGDGRLCDDRPVPRLGERLADCGHAAADGQLFHICPPYSANSRERFSPQMALIRLWSMPVCSINQSFKSCTSM